MAQTKIDRLGVAARTIDAFLVLAEHFSDCNVYDGYRVDHDKECTCGYDAACDAVEEVRVYPF